MARTWAEARRAGALPTEVSLTAAEQLTRARDLLARWDESLPTGGPSQTVVELAAALGVRAFVTGEPDEPGDLPEPHEVPCEHARADGLCTICHDAPMMPSLFPSGYEMPPLPTYDDAARKFAKLSREMVAAGAWQQLTTAEQYVLTNDQTESENR